MGRRHGRVGERRDGRGVVRFQPTAPGVGKEKELRATEVLGSEQWRSEQEIGQNRWVLALSEGQARAIEADGL